MQDDKSDRRVQRTRHRLRGALVQLVKERGYDAVTIQDITDFASLGRTTFYLHYQSKEELLLDHHAEMSAHFHVAILSRDELFGASPQPEMVAFLELMAENRFMYHAIRSARTADVLLRGTREQLRLNLENSLNAIFPNMKPNISMDFLTRYIVGAEIALIDWWLTNRTSYDAGQMAAMLHRLRRTVICDAYPLP